MNKLTIKNKITFLLIFIISVIKIPTPVCGQSYPVQITVNILPPIGVSLAEMQADMAGKMQGTMILTDLTRPSYDVKLKLIIEGQNFILQTKNNLSLPPIRLFAGQPLLVDQSVLLPYFNIENLDIQGIDRQTFIRRGLRMPEGPYNFCLEAYDFHRPEEIAISNRACGSAIVAEYDPPMLMPPDFTNQMLFENQPPAFQQALFTWQPQHLGLFPVEYELRIYRGKPGMNHLPQGVIQNQTAPYIKIKTSNTFYSLSPFDPPLLNEDRYYAEVQIFPINYPAIFKNFGTSQIIEFNLTSNESNNCTAPEQLNGAAIRKGIALNWKSYNYCDKYITHYYDENKPENKYQLLQLKQNEALTDTVTKVFSAHTYILRTGCQCGNDTLYSDTIRITYNRPKAKIPPFECGAPKDMEGPLPELLPQLNVNDTVIAADLRMIVRTAKGSNGIFTGIGHVEIPYFKYAKVNALFDHITLNDEYRMIDGEIKIVGVGQNVLSDDLIKLMNDFIDATQNISDGLGEFNDFLDSLNLTRDLLKDNMPPTLIDSITLIENLIAQTTDDGQREQLEKLLEELNKQKTKWELMYINIIIELVENQFDTCSTQSTQLLENYNNTAKTFHDVTLINGENRSPPMETQLDTKGYAVKTFSISNNDIQAKYPSMTEKYTQYLVARKDYAVCKMIDKIQNNLGTDNVLVFAWNLKQVGADIIKPLREIFEEKNWDMAAIDKDESLRSRSELILIKAIEKIYYKL